ncbi:G-protein-signaling modulator 1-like [Girardinichthys multiradiatus]|uniref:G-protein-signaling modulator 1-like n=1 Tax=Girardinichthys multiradiatus TaxID=208333 RepID=UPI001FAD8731|nr:G-protein-signaling modulator 1-like [Girardinichthys multiradiatus]XP_047238023.1 G-protein-signaling modulator 1-like [Girardinichthys multiradiatus]
MADRNLSSSSSVSYHNIRAMVAKCSPGPHKNASVEQGPEDQSSRTPEAGSISEDESSYSKSWGQSLASVLKYRARTTSSKNKISQAEPEALLDLILKSQSQRLHDQRASLCLLPDSGPPPLCGACSAEKTLVPSLDFYNMLIRYQSDRIEDQRCSLPHPDDDVGPVPEDEENFFNLVQRVQSRRMDEQRASMLHSETQ